MSPGFTVRSFRGIVLSLPAALMFTMDIGAFLVVQDWESEWLIVLNGFLVAWTATGVWVAESSARRRALSRACRALAVASYLLPVSLIVGLIVTPGPENMILSPYVFVFFYALTGSSVGFISWIAARHFARMDQIEEQ